MNYFIASFQLSVVFNFYFSLNFCPNPMVDHCALRGEQGGQSECLQAWKILRKEGIFF